MSTGQATPEGAEERSLPAPAGQDPFDRRTVELAPVYTAARITLAWGFRFGAALLALGIALALVRREPLPTEAEPLPEILPAVLDGHAAGVIDLAIVALILTPVATTLTVALAFLRLGDRRYAALSLVVLAVLGVSIAFSLLR